MCYNINSLLPHKAFWGKWILSVISYGGLCQLYDDYQDVFTCIIRLNLHGSCFIIIKIFVDTIEQLKFAAKHHF